MIDVLKKETQIAVENKRRIQWDEKVQFPF